MPPLINLIAFPSPVREHVTAEVEPANGSLPSFPGILYSQQAEVFRSGPV